MEYLTENPGLSNPTPKTRGVVTELNLRCQKLQIALPEYAIIETSKGQFGATITLGDTSFEEKGPFTNKKLAKKAVVKHGLREHEYLPKTAAPKEKSKNTFQLHIQRLKPPPTRTRNKLRPISQR